MLRLIGAALIFAACTWAGIFAAAAYKRRVSELEAFMALISHIGAQIEGFLTPLDKIYDDFKNQVLDESGFLAALRRDGGVSALDACRERLSITEYEIGELEKFFLGLGHHDVDGESRHCAYFEKRVGELLASARGSLHGKTRVCRAFGMLIGIMLALILL